MRKFDLRANLKSRAYQKKHKSEVSKWVVFGAVAIGIVSTLTYLNKDKMKVVFEGPGGKFVHLLKKSFQYKSEPVAPIIEHMVEPRTFRQPKSVAVRPEDVTSPMIGQWKTEHIANDKKEKQTVFNESNYTPKQVANSIPAPRQVISYSQPKPQPQKNPYRKTHSIPWTWQSYGSGFSKHNKYGKFTYVETEKGIDTGSVCRNYKYGSLDYRDCRKAAKKWFQDRCSSDFRNACVAGNMIP